MKLLKRRGDTSTIRRVETDDEMLLGYIGQVRDFMAEQWVKETTGETIDDIEQATWLYIAIDRSVWEDGGLLHQDQYIYRAGTALLRVTYQITPDQAAAYEKAFYEIMGVDSGK